MESPDVTRIILGASSNSNMPTLVPPMNRRMMGSNSPKKYPAEEYNDDNCGGREVSMLW